MRPTLVDFRATVVSIPFVECETWVFRKQVRNYWHVLDNDGPQLMAAVSQRGAEQGFDTVYIKLGTSF